MSSRDELKAFFAESLIMKDFNHPNVLGLTGVCFDTPDGYPFLILPYNGSLKDHLKKHRVHVTDINTYPKVTVELKNFVSLIASFIGLFSAFHTEELGIGGYYFRHSVTCMHAPIHAGT